MQHNKKRGAFNFKGCKKIYFSWVTMYVNKAAGAQSKIVFSIGKKKIKSAVRRNRVKRKLRIGYYLYKALLEERKVDVLFVVNQDIEITHDNANEEFSKCWNILIKVLNKVYAA